MRRWSFPRPWTPPAPIDRAAERRRLARLAEGIAARDVAVDVDADVVDAVNSERLIRHFPADERGRLALAPRVVLAEPEPARGVCRPAAAASSPTARRGDPQRVRVRWDR